MVEGSGRFRGKLQLRAGLQREFRSRKLEGTTFLYQLPADHLWSQGFVLWWLLVVKNQQSEHHRNQTSSTEKLDRDSANTAVKKSPTAINGDKTYNYQVDLLLPKQVNTLTSYYILPDSGGKPASVPDFSGINAVLCRRNSPQLTPDI
jgi:hypothetical protein